MSIKRSVPIFVICLSLIVTACSIKTVYNQLDFLIPQYVESMISLDDMLEDKLEQRTRILLNWHRNTQLKQYSDWLQRVQQAVIKQADKQTMLRLAEEMNNFWFAISAKVNDEMAMLLPLIGEKQSNELFASLAESNEEFEDDYVTVSENEKRKAYQERMLDNFETWLGSLNDQQVNIITQSANQLKSTAELRLQRRIEWQKGLYQILSDRQNNVPMSQRLHDFMSQFEQHRIRLMKQHSDGNRSVIIGAIVKVSATLTEQQKDHFVMQTNDYIRMFIELSENR